MPKPIPNDLQGTLFLRLCKAGQLHAADPDSFNGVDLRDAPFVTSIS